MKSSATIVKWQNELIKKKRVMDKIFSDHLRYDDENSYGGRGNEGGKI